MAIEFDCPTCLTRIRAPDAAAGKKARCPKCQTICPVPATSTATPEMPPADPFGQMGAGAFDSAPSPANPYPTYPTEPKPASANPFSDAAQSTGGGAPYSNPYGNPYASPTAVNLPQSYPLTDDQVRGRLLGPAIGMCVGAVFCLGYLLLSVGVSLAGGDMANNVPQGGNDAEVIGYYFGMVFALVLMGLPSLLTLLGALAMFRGKGLGMAWTGAIASVLPCSPCCFVAMGFGIWGMVVLSDPRVSQMMRRT